MQEYTERSASQDQTNKVMALHTTSEGSVLRAANEAELQTLSLVQVERQLAQNVAEPITMRFKLAFLRD